MELKKSLVLSALFVSLFLICSVSALNLDVEKVEKVPVIISELKNPAVFDFIITNSGAGEQVEIYSLVGASFEPKGLFSLSAGESTTEVRVYPSDDARDKEGNYAFEYEIKGAGSDIFRDELSIKIVKLANVLSIEPRGVNYGESEAVIVIKNTQNLNLENATLKISSVFFEGEKKISLMPFESTNITFPIETNAIKDLAAGPYVVTSYLDVEDERVEIKDTVGYRERQNVIYEKESNGWIIRTTKITKTNAGNLAVPDRIDSTRNIITRLFTSFSVEPLSTERKGVFVHYRWEKDLNPGDSWSVEINTNYTLPFILILLIVFSAAAVYLYSRTALVVNKRCSFVKTRGGEFALKVMLHVKARKPLDNVEIFDRIPMATQLYEKAGMPHKFEDKIGKLSWKIDRLNAGEERIFSYIIYSKLRIVGRLELPPATVHFVRDGKSQYVSSNRTFFASEIHPRY